MRSVAPSSSSASPLSSSHDHDPSHHHHHHSFRGRGGGFLSRGRGWRRDSRGGHRPGSLSLDVPSDPTVAAGGAVLSAASHSPSGGDRSPSLSPSHGGRGGFHRGGGASSFVSYLRSHVRLPQCPMTPAQQYVERPTLAGALKQQTDTAPPVDATLQHTQPQPATTSDSNTKTAEASITANVSNNSPHGQPQLQPQSHTPLHPHILPFTRSLHPPLHRGSLPLPLSVTTASSPAPLSAHPLSIGGSWQPVSRSIPIVHPIPLVTIASLAPSHFSNGSSLSPSPILSASGLHRSQSDSVKLSLNHSYSQPPPRTSPLPNPPSPAFPSSTASASYSHSQQSLLSTSLSLSPHPSPTGPLARSSSDPLADSADRDAMYSDFVATPASTSISQTPSAAASQLAVDVNPLSLLSPLPSLALTLPAPSPPPAPSLSPASLSFVDRPMSRWTADDVWVWLHQLNLGQYVLFHHRSIDGDMLLDMTDDDLRTELGMDDKFHRGKLLKRIKERAETDKQTTAAAVAVVVPLAGQSISVGTASIAGISADERRDKRDRKAGRVQRHRSRASPHHADHTLHSSSPPYIVPRQLQRPAAPSQPAVQPRDQHSEDGDSVDRAHRYDYYVMQYEVMEALDKDRMQQQQHDKDGRDEDRWEHKTSAPHTTHHTQHFAQSHNVPVEQDGLHSTHAQVLRASSGGAEDGAVERMSAAVVADEIAAVWRPHASHTASNSFDSPVSSSGSDDESEEWELEKLRNERHRRRFHRRTSHDRHSQAPTTPHSHGNIHRSHSAALNTYWPPQAATQLEHIEEGRRDIQQTDEQPQQQQQASLASNASAAVTTISQPPPLPITSVPVSATAQPLAANLSMVSAAFASLSAGLTSSSLQPSHPSRPPPITSRPPASSSLYPPAQQTAVKTSMSVDCLSSAAMHTTPHSQQSPLPSPLPLPANRPSHSPHASHAPVLSPLPSTNPPAPVHNQLTHSHSSHSSFSSASSSYPATHSLPHPHPHHAPSHSPHPSQAMPLSAPAASSVPSRIDRLSSVLRSSPTFIDEVTNLTILSSGVAGHAYSGMFHSLPVVVKLPKTLEISGQEWREWQCHMRLPPHPNLVRFVGALVMQENNFLVTELIRQGSLKGVLAAGGVQGVYSSGYAVLRAALDIGRGLAHMHRQRLVHRDISSRNILVDGDGAFIVADLGLCREMGKHDTAAAGLAAGSDGVGVDGGSSEQYEMSRSTAIPVRWTSPEALLTSSYSSKSDVWALGVTLWEMTTAGAVPYAHVEGNRRLIQQLVHGEAHLEVDEQWEHSSDVGRRARRVIQLCLSPAVDERPNSAQLVELVEDTLQQWQHEETEEAKQRKQEWVTHHERLQLLWEAEAQDAAGREDAKHQQLMDAAALNSPVSTTAAAAAGYTPTASHPLPSAVDEEEEQRGLELVQPAQQRRQHNSGAREGWSQ